MPWTSTVRCLGHVLYSKLLFIRRLHTVANKATAVICNIFSFLARDWALTQTNKLDLYKLFIRSSRNYAAPVWSSTCSSNYHRLQVIQSKCVRVIGNHPRRTANSILHNNLNIEPTHFIFNRLMAKYFSHCPPYPKPLVQQIGNYNLADLTNIYRKYKHKRT